MGREMFLKIIGLTSILTQTIVTLGVAKSRVAVWEIIEDS